MKKIIRSKSDTKLIIEYKLVAETLNANINKLKTNYIKKGHLLPKATIMKKPKGSRRGSEQKHSKLYYKTFI